jgi:hypothetical protein
MPKFLVTSTSWQQLPGHTLSIEADHRVDIAIDARGLGWARIARGADKEVEIEYEAEETVEQLRKEMNMKTWSNAQIDEQQKLVNAAEPNRLYYERGRLDCMKGDIIPPPASSIEKLQWEEGWRHEHLGIERPF